MTEREINDFTRETKAAIEKRRRELVTELIREGQHYSLIAAQKFNLRQEFLADILVGE